MLGGGAARTRACTQALRVSVCGITGGQEFYPGSSMLSKQTFLNMMMVQSSDHRGCPALQRGFYLFIFNQLVNTSSVIVSQSGNVIWGFNQIRTNYFPRTIPNPGQHP